MDAECISRYGCRLDIQVLIQSGYLGMDAERISRYGCRVDIKVLLQSGYLGIDKISRAENFRMKYPDIPSNN